MSVVRFICTVVLLWQTVAPVDASLTIQAPALAISDQATSADRAVQLAAGSTHICALTQAGSVKCWGGNGFGQLGTGTTFISTYLPTPVRGLPPVRAIAAGETSTCAITTADDLYCWGRGELYALGNAATAVVTRPFKLLSGVKTVDMGWNHGCAALLNGALKCWGRVAYITPEGTTRVLGSQTPGDVIQPQGSPVVQLTGGNQSSCALLASGAVSCWGLTGMIDYGVSGVVPPTVIGTGFSTVSADFTHLCGVTGGGSVQCLGANAYGQTGQPLSTPAFGTLLAVPGVTGMTAVATGARHTCTLDSAQRLWCWGDNSSGQLGRGRTGAADPTPGIAVAVSQDVVQVVAASLSTCALTGGGKVYCWGSNTYRQTTARAAGSQVWPVRVPGFGPVTDGPVAVTVIEVTQGIQNLSNDMPLVAQRPTVARVFARSTSGATVQPVIALTGLRGGVPLPGSPLAPINSLRVTAAGGDRLSFSGGYYFELPPAWVTAGALDLQVENLSSALVCEDYTGVPADCRASVMFEAVPAAQLVIVGLPYLNASGVRVGPPSLADKRQAAQQLLRAFPVPGVNWTTVDSPHASPYPLGRDAEDGWAMLNDVAIPLLQRRGSDGCRSPCTTVYMYLLADPPASGLEYYGVSLTGQGVGMSYTYHPVPPNPGDYLLFAHEVGHGYGLNHAPCKGAFPANSDPAFPDLQGRIDATLHGDHGFVGLDVSRRHLYAPDSTYDLMSYCVPNWLSNYNAEKLLDRMQTGVDFPSLPASSGPTALATGDMLVITGAIDPAAHVAVLAPVFDVPAAAAPASGGAGPYAARLLDSALNTLASLPLVVSAASDDVQGLQAFIGFTPRPAGLARLQILENGQVIGERVVSAHAPTVTVAPLSGPVGDTLTLTWTGADADGDPLRYWVQVSDDLGTTWRTLATDLAQTSLSVDTTTLPGTVSGQLRVIASDGLLSASASSGVVQISGHAPDVAIVAPLPASAYQVDSTIVVEAAAFDAEDGSALPDSAYVWSTTDGQVLATGRIAAIDAAMLSPDAPILRVTVTDSALTQASAEVDIVLEAPPALYGLYLTALGR